MILSGEVRTVPLCLSPSLSSAGSSFLCSLVTPGRMAFLLISLIAGEAQSMRERTESQSPGGR